MPGAVESAQATTLNNIPREFIPPALRSYDPQAQSKRRGPGRPRQDAEDAEDGNRLNDWEVVKKGGGLENNPQLSPFDAMIAADEAEEERLGLTKRKRGRAKKTTTAAVAINKVTGTRLISPFFPRISLFSPFSAGGVTWLVGPTWGGKFLLLD
jgi:hypothetical protein